MANKDPSRTERPTARKLKKTREKGNVLTCPDLSSFVIILVGTLLLFITLPWTADAFRYTLGLVLQANCRESWSDHQVWTGTIAGAKLLAQVLAPACLGICLTAYLIMRWQVGKFFSFKPLHWKFNHLFRPQAAFKELLPNKRSAIRLGINSIKVFIVGYFIYVTLRNEFGELLNLNMMPIVPAVRWVALNAVILVFKILGVFVLVVAASYWHRKHEYYDNLMMTKQEVKDEHKDMEGDPRVKAKIRGKMRELFVRIMMGNLKKADVVITNPTHVAVALRYKPEDDAAPIVIAKGLRKRALRIKMLAKLYGVPVVEAPPLARSLYRNVKIGAFIPPEFYRAVAAILAKLHRSGMRNMLLKKSA